MAADAAEPLHALLAEFSDPDALVAAVREARRHGYRKLDALTPFPVPGLADEIGFNERTIPYAAAVGFFAGFLGVLTLQVWMNAIDYPINVGGRPLLSWPAFAYSAFQVGCFTAALFAMTTMLRLNGLPRYAHPLHRSEALRRATQDRFFMVIDRDDRIFAREATHSFLHELGALRVLEV